jgi:[ribosomal protein S5]-alanine N-acetyltransferase
MIGVRSYFTSLPDGYTLTSARIEDRDDYVRLLGDGEVASVIPAIPQPYTREIGEAWIRHRLQLVEDQGCEICFSIRGPTGALAGSVGVNDLVVGSAVDGELGYWLGIAHRGRGIMRAAVRAFIPYAFGRLALERLTAHALPSNGTSARILTGAGFRLEGRLPHHIQTPSGRQDALVFGLLRSEWQTMSADSRAID